MSSNFVLLKPNVFAFALVLPPHFYFKIFSLLFMPLFYVILLTWDIFSLGNQQQLVQVKVMP